MQEKKKTLVIGASEKPERYANRAIRQLRRYGHPVEAIGLRAGKVEDVKFKTGLPELQNIHTVTLYIGQVRQKPYYEYLIKLKPQRIIFNPGTENGELEHLAQKHGIATVENCTLVMLSSGLF